jgi:hypothetical protein
MDGQLIAIFDRLNDFVDIGKIKAGIQPVGVHIQRDRHQINIAGALTIAEQTTLNAVSAGQ